MASFVESESAHRPAWWCGHGHSVVTALIQLSLPMKLRDGRGDRVTGKADGKGGGGGGGWGWGWWDAREERYRSSMS